MKAGLRKVDQPESISPLEVETERSGNSCESDADDEAEVVEDGETVERLALEKEGAVVKKLVDPKLPSRGGVEDHYVRGHFPY